MVRYFTVLACLFPGKMAVLFLKLLGHNVHWTVKIGFSFVAVQKLDLAENSKIGHFNFISIRRISLEKSAYIGHVNLIKGPMTISLKKTGAIGNRNSITRAKIGVVYGDSELYIGELSKITARHTVDLTRSVSIGDFSTLAGAGSQIWTHGYVHGAQGRERIRVDGEVTLKNNVYIGSNCVINAGVEVKSAITVGSNSTISKDLTKPGMYVGQALRYFDKDLNDVKEKLKKVNGFDLIEDVYEK